MNRHVIKGRGGNRGKYLRWGYVPGATSPVVEWVRKQSKASRFDDPNAYKGNHTARVASEHNGYVVKLIAPKAIEDVDALRSFIADRASGATEALPAHWVHGAGEIDLACVSRDGWYGDFDGEAADFCHDCCEEVVEAIFTANSKEAEDVGVCVDGGWGTEHDSPPFCEKCGAKLSGSLTDYGADEEISALTTDCAPRFDDVEGWDSLDNAVSGLDDDDPRWREIARIVSAAREDERKAAEEAAALAASPGMPEARAAFLSLLAVRKEQKAPDPSFRLWRTLLRWHSLPYERRSKPTRLIAAVEKKLVREAKRFADTIGYRSHWSGGMFMIESPNGTYYWPFVVEREQRRLWNERVAA